MSSVGLLDDEFSAFYREHFHMVVRAVHSIAGHSAEDVAQEAFIAAGRHWDRVADLELPLAWVRLVALRMAMRRAQRDTARPLLEATAGAGSTLSLSARDLDLADAIAQLPSRKAAAVWLHHVEDWSVDEVAEWLGCGRSAVKVQLHRTRRLLAERVGGFSGRWVSEAEWTKDDVVTHLRTIGAAEHVDTVLETELEGRGGRWELTLDHGEYRLRRDDGMRLDEGKFVLRGDALELVPTLLSGHLVLRTQVDGARLRMTSIENTTPPSRGVPDVVWMSLFLDAGPFEYAGRM